ncbi:hypothetical protein [Mesorhizobium sp. INR15]|uniref:hypothetical protein n=1 Tax=Mesorhizobium sp. INR15 TaxID=2654248 RepID=UPI0018966E30|nr:hypothetical protein [Mesorhizobium sp. INR15]QPC96056.1 hypothetical protein GA829_36685 [Mesorhizobium sp. INR15]
MSTPDLHNNAAIEGDDNDDNRLGEIMDLAHGTKAEVPRQSSGYRHAENEQVKHQQRAIGICVAAYT